jgi:ornithine cyclodeaminase/alanine dehydrogenase
MPDAIPIVEQVLRDHALGTVAMPAKVTMDLAPFGLKAWNTAMPAYIESLGASGVKWVGGFAENRERYGLPFLIALILVQDPRTGYPLAIMDGVHITNLRTGAVTALAVRHYGRRDARRLALIGAGTQARFTVSGVTRITRLDEIRVHDIDAGAARRFADEIAAGYGIEVRTCPDAESAVRGADVVVTATTSTSPIVRARWLAPGVTMISIGSQGQEFDDDAVLGADKLVCDSWEQCTHLGELRAFAESGRLTRDNVHAEIGDTIAGVRSGRERDDESIMVVPIGLGSLDVALARVAHERIQARGQVAAFRFFE